MAVETAEFRFSTHGDGDVVDFTGEVQGMVEEIGATSGQALCFVRGSTAALLIDFDDRPRERTVVVQVAC